VFQEAQREANLSNLLVFGVSIPSGGKTTASYEKRQRERQEHQSNFSQTRVVAMPKKPSAYLARKS
jgi:hypothetical protein